MPSDTQPRSRLISRTAGPRVLLQELIEDGKLESYIPWFYTPMALPLAEELQPVAVIYDCMDELSGFLGRRRN